MKIRNLLAALAASLAFVSGTAGAQKALVYCPVGIDATGCGKIVSAIQSQFADGVDRGYDGTNGTVDIRVADLNHYSVVIVPSLADNGDIKPYALLRANATRFKMAISGRVSVYSGSPDQGSANRADKDALIASLAKWTAAGHTRKTGLVGLVAFLDLSSDVASRYGWVNQISAADVSADPDLKSSASVQGMTAHGNSVVAPGGKPIAYANMATYGLHLGKKSSAGTYVGAQAGGSDQRTVLIQFALAEGNKKGGKRSGPLNDDAEDEAPSIVTDKADYLPGDTVTFTGAGWVAGDVVTIRLHEDPQWTHQDRLYTATADADGKIFNRDFIVDAHDYGVTFTVQAVAEPSGLEAQTTFTDGNLTGVTSASMYVPGGSLCGATISSYSGGTTSVCYGATIDVTQNPQLSIVYIFYKLDATTGLATQQFASAAFDQSSALANSQFRYTYAPVGGLSTGQWYAGICDMNGAGYNASKVGNCTVTVTNGVASSTSVLGLVSFTVGNSALPAPTVSFTGTSTYGATNLVAVASGSGTGVTYSYASTTSGVCTINATTGAVTIVSSGTCSITATASKTGFTSSTGSGSTTIAKADQTITWSNPADITYGTPLGATQLNATTSGNGALSYTPATGTVLNAGTAQTLSVTAASTTNYNAATKTVSINVLKANQPALTLTTSSSLTYAGTAGTSSTSGGAGGGAVTYSAGTSTGCSVDANTGAITVTNATGTCAITATKAGDTNYNPVTSAPSTVTLSKATATISLSNLTATYDGNAHAATATTSPAGLTVVSITYDGLATVPINGGTYTVSATLTNNNYQATAATGSLVIGRAEQVISWSTPADITYGTALGATQLNATVTTGNGALTYTPATGTVLGAGNAQTLSVTAAQTQNYNAKSASVSINVLKASQATLTLTTSGSLTYGVAGTSSTTGGTGTGAVTYSAGGSTGCSVDANSGAITVTNASGSCAISATKAGDANYNPTTAGPNTVTLGKATATVSLANLTATYDGAVHSVTATTNPIGLTVTFTGNGQTAAGSYPVTATVSDNNYQGSASGSLEIGKATATINVSGYTGTYDASAHGATGTATGIGSLDLSSLLHLGSSFTNVPGGTANWAFDGNGNYNSASGSAAIVINKASQTISFTAPTGLTFGDAPVTLSGTASSGLSVSYSATGGCTVSGSTLTITGAGTCTITASQAGDGNYSAAAPVERTTSVAKQAATISITDLAKTYTGSPQGATVTVSPSISGLSVTYDGSATVPTNAGSYTVSASLTNDNYTAATQTGTLVIGKATATVTLLSLTATYDGSVHTATYSTSPTGLTVTLTGGTGTSAGSYPVTGTISDANYQGSASDNLVIGKANATINVTGFTGAYDGSAHGATGTATGAGGVDLSASLNLGASFTNVPGGTASWSFTGGTNYNDASGTAAITISAASQTISFTAPTGLTYGDAPVTLTATASSGLAVSYSATGGCSVSGSTLTITGAGDCVITASQGGNTNYSAAASVERTTTVAKKSTTIILSNLTATYDGSAHAATATTSPAGLTGVSITYDGSASAPVAGGTYAVSATLDNANYQAATATGSLVIGKANATISVTGYSGAYDAAAHGATGTAAGVGSENLSSLLDLGASFTNVPGGTASWSFAGNGNYNSASGSVAITITKADQSALTLNTSSSLTYGTAGTSSTTGGLGTGGVTFSSGSSTGCSVDATTGAITVTNASGTCAISATKAGDQNYNAVSAGPNSVALSKAAGTVTLGGLTATYDGTAHSATATTSPAALTLTWSGNGQTNAGSYPVTATIVDNNYEGSASGSLVIGKADATISVSGFTGSFDGSAHGATGTATGIGGADLSSMLHLGSSFTSFPGGTASWSFDGNGNYNAASGTAAIVISKASVTVTPAGGKTKTFGDVFTAFTGTVSGLQATDAGSASYASTGSAAAAGVGGYDITSSDLVLSTGSLSNYAVTYNTATGGLTVGKASSTTAVTCTGTPVYTGDAQTPCAVSVTGAGGLSETPAPVYSGNVNAGTNTASASYTYDGDANHTGSSDSKSFSIAKATVTVTADAQTKVYGQDDPALTYTAGALAAGNSFTGVLSRAAGSTVGSYAISKGTLSAGSNYDISYTGASLTVTSKPITGSYTAAGKTYDGSATAALSAPTLNGTVSGDAVSLIGGAGSFADANAGTGKPVTVSGASLSGAAAGNYSLSGVTANAADIAPKTLTVTANNKSKTFDGLVYSPFTSSYSGFASGEGVSVITGALTYAGAATTATTNGAYTITPVTSGLTNTNYSYAVSSGTLTITKAAVVGTVTTDVGSQIYTGAVTFTAKLPTAAIGGEATATSVKFYVGTQEMMGTPALVADGAGLKWVLTQNLLETVPGALQPGLKTVKAVFQSIGNDFTVNEPTTSLTITPKPAAPLGTSYYTGETVYWTPNTTSSTATLMLSASLQDACHAAGMPAGYMTCGDISKATLTFGIRNGSTFTPLTGALKVGYVNATDPSIGTAAASVQYNIGNANSADLQVAVKIGGLYSADDPTTDVLITVSKPVIGNELKFAGTNLLGNATPFAEAGTLKGADGYYTGVTGDITYTSKYTNPQGSITMLIQSLNGPNGAVYATPHTFSVKSNAISTLSIQKLDGTASFSSKASIVDLTTGAGVDGGALLQITVKKGTATTGGAISVQLNNQKTGGLWYSGAWDGQKTVAKPIASGTILVN